MSGKNLSFFMRESRKHDEIVSVPCPEDVFGEKITLEFKILSAERLSQIRKAYTIKKMVFDKKGNPIVSDGELVYETDYDNLKVSRHMLAESLVYPDLKDKQLMEYFSCLDFTDMPTKVFSQKELTFIMKAFDRVHGYTEENANNYDNSNETATINEIKN